MIIGTAGHIDHGKTALVRALTGVDTDRLKEEKARGISIDLGFAYLPAGDGGILGFVDVPGHEKFVRNMLAGATGIDFVLLVVAADDGIMPQTREHLAIVDLLGLTRGLVALTKIDLVPPERRAQVAQDVRQMLQTTGLASAQVVPVSASTGEGIGELRDRLLGGGARRRAAQRARSLSAGRGSVLQPHGCGNDRDGGCPFRGGSGRRHRDGQPRRPARTGALDPRAERGRATRRGRGALRPQPRRRGHRQARNRPRCGRARPGPACSRESHRCDGATARNGGQGARALDARARVSRGSGSCGACRAAGGSADRARWQRAHPARAGAADCGGGARSLHSARHFRVTHDGRRLLRGSARPAAAPSRTGTTRAARGAGSRRPGRGTRDVAGALAVLHGRLRVRARSRTRGGADSGGPARGPARAAPGGRQHDRAVTRDLEAPRG